MTPKLTLLLTFLLFYWSLLKVFSCSTQQQGKAWLGQNLEISIVHFRLINMYLHVNNLPQMS